MDAAALIANGVIYIGSRDHYVYALDSKDGSTKWKQEVGGDITTTAEEMDGKIFVGSLDRYLYSFDLDSGDPLWSFETGGPIWSSPVAQDETVYFGSTDDHIYALETETGALKWKFSTSDDVMASPTVRNGVLFACSYDHHVYALDIESGQLNWKAEIGWACPTKPAVNDELVYVGSFDGRIYALDVQTGALRWNFLTGGNVWSSPIVGNGVVYFGSYDGHLYALSAKSGTLLWRFRTGGEIHSSPATMGEIVYVGSNDDSLYAIDAGSGSLVWSIKTGDDVTARPEPMGDTVYVGSHDYAVYAIAAGFPPGYIRLSPKVANVPDEFVAMPPTELRDLLNTILDLPSLGAESHTYSEQGVTTVDLDFTEQAVAIFETGYYSLTDVSPESEGWTPRILSLEDYIDLVDKEHGGNPEIKQWLAYCCERTTDGLELIIKGGLPSPSVIAGVAHEAGHARQRIRNPVQSKYDGPNHAAIHEAEAFALAAGLIRELGGYAGVNATLFPIESNSSSYIRNWTSSTQALLEDMTEEHLRGRALLWEAVLHDPLLEDLRGELIEQKILSSESLLRLHNYLVDLPPAGIDAYVENMLSKFTADRKLIEETLLRRIASLPSEGFAEHERGLFLLP